MYVNRHTTALNTSERLLQLYRPGEIVTFVYHYEYANGIPVGINEEPPPWETVKKYKVCKGFKFRNSFVYEIVSERNTNQAKDTISGISLYTEAEYERLIQDWKNFRLYSILAS